MTAKIKLANIDDFINRYKAGVSLKQLSEELGFSRAALGRILREHGVPIRNRSQGSLERWRQIKASGETEKILGAAWKAADARNSDLERKVLNVLRKSERSCRPRTSCQNHARMCLIL